MEYIKRSFDTRVFKTKNSHWIWAKLYTPVCWATGNYEINMTGRRPSSYEQHVITILNKEHIYYRREQTFDFCLSTAGNKLRFDFTIECPRGMILIEVDGEYHYRQTGIYPEIHNNDTLKNQFVENNPESMMLIRISYKIAKLANKNLHGLLINTINRINFTPANRILQLDDLVMQQASEMST